MDQFVSRNPFNGTVHSTFSHHSDDELATRLAHCASSQKTITKLSYSDRGACLRRAAALLRNRADEFSVIMAEEMGKPLAQGRAESIKCAWVCEHYADHGESQLAAETADIESVHVTIEYAPMGVILAIMPWNFPFWQAFRCAAPVIMAGNAVLLKHAPNVPRCALAIEQVFRDAGFPDGVLTNVFAGVSQVEGLIAHRQIAGVTLTGSTRAGRAVAALAGTYLKPSVLELGGSDPYIVLEGADIDQAVSKCVTSRLLNSGQSCIAAKRFLLHTSVADPFKEKLFEAIAETIVGDPMNDATDVGPMARPDLANQLREQVEHSIKAGAGLAYQGTCPDGDCIVPVTVLDKVRPNMPAWNEELFGPVFALITFANDDEAVEMANDSVYGLGAGVFSADIEHAQSVAKQLQCGNVAINDFVKSDPRYPFGGVKDSGYGRELGKQGIRAFTNVKTTCTAK